MKAASLPPRCRTIRNGAGARCAGHLPPVSPTRSRRSPTAIPNISPARRSRLIAAGRDASAQINLLLTRRTAIALRRGPGFEAIPLDTAWAVIALARAGQGAGTPASDARAYLMASLQSDGGVAARTDALRVEYSAAALYALQTTGDGSAATTIRALSAWLLQRQRADGSWQGDTYLTAFSVIAVVPTMSDQAVRRRRLGLSARQQGAAGSWQDDPFLTAVALRALSVGSASPRRPR